MVGSKKSQEDSRTLEAAHGRAKIKGVCQSRPTSSESQSTGDALYDLCSIFLQRFEVFQGVGYGVQLIVEGVWLVESQLEW